MKARGFLFKTIHDFTDTLEQALFAEDVARRAGVLQSLDPRAKLLGALVLLIAISLSHNALAILTLALLTFPLALASRVPLGFYLKRVWIPASFFTGLIALPALSSPLTPGAPLVTLIDSTAPRLYLAITAPGVLTALLLWLRAGTSISIAVLLVLTTRWMTLLQALRILRVPQAFVLILGMTYRYLFVLLHTANHLFLARQSRLVGRVAPAEERRWLAATAGTLFAKSYALSEEVYLAMQARGFRGEARVLQTLTWRARDGLWLAGWIGIAALVVWS